MVKSINKGKGYELQKSKTFTKWAAFNIIRTPQSGAWQGTAGDLIPENRERPFLWLIECKKAERWNMEAIMSNNCSLFNSWLQQLKDEALTDFNITGTWRLPVLIFSRNRKPDYICIPASYVSLLAHNIVMPTFFKLHSAYDGCDYTIIPFDEFVTHNSFGLFENFVTSYLKTSSAERYFKHAIDL